MSPEFYAVISMGTTLAAMILALYVSIFAWIRVIKSKIELSDGEYDRM